MQRIAIAAVMAALIGGSSAAEAQRVVAARDVPPGHRPPPGMCRVWIDGVAPGRQPRATDCATARAMAPRNSRIIVGDRAPFPGQARGRVARDCTYDRTTGPLGEIIFGRRVSDRNVDCRYDSRRQVGAWYEVGRDRNGTRVYERTVRDRRGRTVIERAYRARGGRFVVFDSRTASGSVRRAARGF